ncbi:MAG: YncE family protein, partial [Candidatus Methylomirabilales bacterium]
GAHGLALRPDGKVLFVANRNADTVSAVNPMTRAVLRQSRVPGGPDMMSVTPDGRELWVTSRYRNYIHVVDAREYKVLARIQTDLSPHGVTFSWAVGHH